MKNTLKAISATIFLFFLIYLIGCFIEASFNILIWDKGTRACIGLFGGLLSLLFGGFLHDWLESEKK